MLLVSSRAGVGDDGMDRGEVEDEGMEGPRRVISWLMRALKVQMQI